jgi:hypothetical protein
MQSHPPPLKPTLTVAQSLFIPAAAHQFDGNLRNGRPQNGRDGRVSRRSQKHVVSSSALDEGRLIASTTRVTLMSSCTFACMTMSCRQPPSKKGGGGGRPCCCRQMFLNDVGSLLLGSTQTKREKAIAR